MARLDWLSPMNPWRRWRNRYTIGDMVYDASLLHYAEQYHAAGDDETAQRILDRMKWKTKKGAPPSTHKPGQ